MKQTKIIAVDFDGTIVEHAYPRIGKPIPFALEALRLLQSQERCLLVLWTVRTGELLQEAVEYCAGHGVEFYAVNQNYPGEEVGDTPRKLAVDIFIDDRNVGGLPDWRDIYATLTGTGWSGKPSRRPRFFRVWRRAKGNDSSKPYYKLTEES